MPSCRKKLLIGDVDVLIWIHVDDWCLINDELVGWAGSLKCEKLPTLLWKSFGSNVINSCYSGTWDDKFVEFHPPRQSGSGMLSNTIVLVWRKWRRPPSCCCPGGMKYIEISPARFVSRILFNTMYILCIRFKGMHVCKHVCSPGSQSKVEGDTPIPGEGRSFIVEMSEMSEMWPCH